MNTTESKRNEKDTYSHTCSLSNSLPLSPSISPSLYFFFLKIFIILQKYYNNQSFITSKLSKFRNPNLVNTTWHPFRNKNKNNYKYSDERKRSNRNTKKKEKKSKEPENVPFDGACVERRYLFLHYFLFNFKRESLGIKSFTDLFDRNLNLWYCIACRQIDIFRYIYCRSAKIQKSQMPTTATPSVDIGRII